MDCIIVSGGTVDCSQLKAFLSENRAYIIAADRGIEACIKINIRPEAVIGDFDSANKEALEQLLVWETEGTKVIRLNPIKDSTDTEASIRYATEELLADSITIFGATGTRIDHVLGNISLLLLGEKENTDITLLDKNNRIRLRTKSFSINNKEQFGKYVSLFPVGGEVSNLTLKGFYYTLSNHTLTGETSLCVSNEITDDEARVEFSSGKLLLIESRD